MTDLSPPIVFPSTGNVTEPYTKTLLAGIHGSGKTFAIRHWQERYGKTFVISGEGGLLSLSDVEIDYLPFSSWDGEHDPARGVYSYKGICTQIIASEWFRDQGYKCIALDSLVELSERCHQFYEANPQLWQTAQGKKNPLEMWGKYGQSMIGALKWLRDLPYHVVVTTLVKEEYDDNGDPSYWPLVKGAQVGRQIPGVFDYVFGLIKQAGDDKNNPVITRRCVTQEVRGWKCKARDPRGRLAPIENLNERGDVTELLARVTMSEEAWNAYKAALQQASA